MFLLSLVHIRAGAGRAIRPTTLSIEGPLRPTLITMVLEEVLTAMTEAVMVLPIGSVVRGVVMKSKLGLRTTVLFKCMSTSAPPLLDTASLYDITMGVHSLLSRLPVWVEEGGGVVASCMRVLDNTSAHEWLHTTPWGGGGDWGCWVVEDVRLLWCDFVMSIAWREVVRGIVLLVEWVVVGVHCGEEERLGAECDPVNDDEIAMVDDETTVVVLEEGGVSDKALDGVLDAEDVVSIVGVVDEVIVPR